MPGRLIAYDSFRALRFAREYIGENAFSPLRLSDAADAAGYSPYHFHRRFREAFGETPQELRTRIRLEEAKRLLRVSNLSVTEICFEVGYESLGSFSTLFQERTGCSPTEFRRVYAFPDVWAKKVVPGCFFAIGAVPLQSARIEKP